MGGPARSPADWPESPQAARGFWEARIARQKAIDASIAEQGGVRYLYDRPYADPKTVVSPDRSPSRAFSPHRTLGVDEHDELIDPLQIKERAALNRSSR